MTSATRRDARDSAANGIQRALGAEIRHWRTAVRGLDRATLAAAASTSETTLGRIERGEHADLATVVRIAAALDVHLSTLVERAEQICEAIDDDAVRSGADIG